ncbi:winged helix DNA-binding domain-containing protein [Mumia sp. DW29H23]|uniref:winged helix DNA-binding domain-containing protein n=1 Tax=Mumia sp. DW29H23 TaxID=3421241 RepID=UPI003D69598D
MTTTRASYTDAETRMTRARAQRLGVNRSRDPVEVVRDLVGVQAQDMPSARLALRPRTIGVTAADVRKCHDEDRTLVRIWAMRGTLHMVAAEDVGWLVGLLGPVFAAADQRRRDQLGLDDDLLDKAMPAVRGILGRHGPLTRADLVERLDAHRVRLDLKTQGPAHLVGYAAMTGLVCRGPDVEKGEPTYVLVEDWIGKQRTLEGDGALAELTRRYVASRGPVTPDDFKRWTGLPARQARHGFALVAEQLTEVETVSGTAFVLKGTTRRRPRREPAVELVGMFDEYLLGYANRDLVLDPRFAKRIQTGGFVKPAVLLDGRVVGTWSQKRTAGKVTITVEPFEDLTEVGPRLAGVVRDVGRFLETNSELRMGEPQ